MKFKYLNYLVILILIFNCDSIKPSKDKKNNELKIESSEIKIDKDSFKFIKVELIENAEIRNNILKSNINENLKNKIRNNRIEQISDEDLRDFPLIIESIYKYSNKSKLTISINLNDEETLGKLLKNNEKITYSDIFTIFHRTENFSKKIITLLFTRNDFIKIIKDEIEDEDEYSETLQNIIRWLIKNNYKTDNSKIKNVIRKIFIYNSQLWFRNIRPRLNVEHLYYIYNTDLGIYETFVKTKVGYNSQFENKKNIFDGLQNVLNGLKKGDEKYIIKNDLENTINFLEQKETK